MHGYSIVLLIFLLHLEGDNNTICIFKFGGRMGDCPSLAEEDNISLSEDVCSAFMGLGDFDVFATSHCEIKGTNG